MFAEDGDALARYIDARLTNGGFDNGGPRYSEQHSAFESVLGLRYFSRRIGSDLGRYRGDSRWARHAVKADGEVDGHFAWMLVWQIQDATRWYRPRPGPGTAPTARGHGLGGLRRPDDPGGGRGGRYLLPGRRRQPPARFRPRHATASYSAARWARSASVTSAATD